MSAYKRIECEFKDKETLLEALDFLELDYKEYESPESLKGWKNDVRKEKAHIIVSKESLNKNLTGASNDVGFLWNEEDQRFEMICSQYDQSRNVDKKIIQSYAKSAIEKVLKEKEEAEKAGDDFFRKLAGRFLAADLKDEKGHH